MVIIIAQVLMSIFQTAGKLFFGKTLLVTGAYMNSKSAMNSSRDGNVSVPLSCIFPE